MLMNKLIIVLIAVLFSLAALDPVLCSAQPTISPTTVKGDLLTIKGDTYLLRDLSGVLRRIKVDKNTEKERFVVPGEKIEVQVSPDGRAISIKPVQ